jgi:acyl dehydratase
MRLQVGDVHEEVVVDDLKRTRIVMYAGASGDFNPVHTDETFATAIGMPGVFGHGMLTMGMTGRAVTAMVGHGTLTAYAAQFRRQVWPGDTLTVRCEVVALREEAGDRLVDLTVTTTNQDGDVVLTGTATARADDPEPEDAP